MTADAVTDAERAAAGRWLVKHRVDVPTMTDLLALRLGVRAGARPPGSWRWIGLAVLGYVAATIGFASLAFLPGVRGVDLVDSSYIFFLVIVQQLGYWLPARARDRRALARFGTPGGPPRTEAAGWFLAVSLVTFGGGAALAVTIFATTPFRTYAWSWLLLLALGAAVTAAIVTDVFRRPVIAEDTTSGTVDTALRLHDLFIAMPGVYAFPVLVDPLVGHAQPPEWRPWLVGYAVFGVATQVVVGVVQWRRLRAVLGGELVRSRPDRCFAGQGQGDRARQPGVGGRAGPQRRLPPVAGGSHRSGRGPGGRPPDPSPALPADGDR